MPSGMDLWLEFIGGREELRTNISVKASSGISVNFSPWCFGITNCHLSYQHISISPIQNLRSMPIAKSGCVNWGLGLRHTAWPRESGLISRNARTLSDSKSLREGMSPVLVSLLLHPLEEIERGKWMYLWQSCRRCKLQRTYLRGCWK
jgi:hypothetical protein